MSGLLNNLPEAFNKVTFNTCAEIIDKISTQEDKYWSEDEKLDEAYAENAEEDCAGRCLFENEGEDSRLDDL
jgi:hypothetical protein